MSSLFSGEPIPLAPNVEDKEEMERWIFKVREWMRRLGIKLDQGFNNPAPPAPPDPPSLSRVPTIVLNLKRNQFGSAGVIATTEFLAGRDASWGSSSKNASVPWETNPNKTPNLIPWRDKPYLIASGQSGIEIREDGLYHITFNIEPDTEQNLAPFDEFFPLVDARILLRDGNTAMIPQGALTSVEHLESFSIQGTYPIKAGIIIETECVIHFEDIPGGLPRPRVSYDTGTNLQVLKLADGITGGDADPPGFGWPPGVSIPPWIWSFIVWH